MFAVIGLTQETRMYRREKIKIQRVLRQVFKIMLTMLNYNSFLQTPFILLDLRRIFTPRNDGLQFCQKVKEEKNSVFKFHSKY